MRHIEPALAKEIVHQMKSILNEEINFMDHNGIIIASTDPSRIGDYHEGAEIVVREKREVIIHSETEYEGAKPGANVPIRFEEDIIGVIGITGNIKVVGKYPKILQQMTEILIKESFVSELLAERFENYRLVIQELLNKHEGGLNNTFRPSQIFGIDLGIPRVIIVGKQNSPIIEASAISRINRTLADIFHNDNQSFFSCSTQEIIVISRYTNDSKLKQLIETLKDKLSFIEPIYFGISNVVKDRSSYSDAAWEARIASQAATAAGQTSFHFEDMGLSLLAGSLPTSIKSIYVERTLGNLSSEELEYYKNIFDVFTEHDGSITKAAADLFIHKNTLQYQINKLKDLTGLDLRRYSDYTKISLAYLILEMTDYFSRSMSD